MPDSCRLRRVATPVVPPWGVPGICSCCGESVALTVELPTRTDVHICHWCLDGLNRQRDLRLKLKGDWPVVGFEPIFQVADIAQATEHYARMGFDIDFHDGTYAFAHRDPDLTIHLALAEGDDQPGGGSLYIHCLDADQVASEWRRAGLDVVSPEDQEYGKREGSTKDPDGNLIRFGSPVRTPVDRSEPYPELDLAVLIGLAPEEAAAMAEGAGVAQIRLIELGREGRTGQAIDMMLAPRRLDLVHQDGRVEFAAFPTFRSAGAWPTPPT
jgi:hypothetical protein